MHKKRALTTGVGGEGLISGIMFSSAQIDGLISGGVGGFNVGFLKV